MPRTRDKRRTVRLNFTVWEEDAERIRALAALVVPDGDEPNASLAVRLAVKGELERRTKHGGKTR